MGFEKGRAKTGGRKKGLPNKRSLKVQEKAEQLGIDPFQILLYFASGNWKALGYTSETYTRYAKDYSNEEWTIEPAVRAKAAAEACQYLHPKRKAVEFEEVKKKKRPLRGLTNEQLTALAKKE